MRSSMSVALVSKWTVATRPIAISGEWGGHANAIATGYTVLANGGFQVGPYFVSSIESAAGDVIEAPAA